ncbi:MAG: CBS domain-containing protein [Sphingobacteriaceae bacterium]
MLAAELISDLIPPLRTADTVQKATERMAEFRVSHLPVLSDDDDQFLSLIADDDFIEARDLQLPLSALHLFRTNAFVLETQHIYEVIRSFSDLKLSVVPVLDHKKNFLGLITLKGVVEYFSRLTAVSEPGGIIVLEISNRNNSLAHMAQIVESDNAQILSSYIQSFPDSTRMEVTLKVNKQDVSGIVSAFLRYDYTIKATFNNIADDDAMDRYDSFMNYLNI